MSAAEDTIKAKGVPDASNAVPVLDRVMNFMSSVRVGVIQLCILVVLAMIGMLIMQQNVNGFDTYYASLTPAEKSVYGALGFFNIYYSWYFKLLLLTLSLNILLASIDRFPSVWKNYFSRPKLTATPEWLLSQKENAVIAVPGTDRARIAEELKAAFEANGLKTSLAENESIAYPLDTDGNKIYGDTVRSNNLFVFGQSGRANRLGAYIVHVFLLTLFLGHFIALQTGFDADVRMIPGDATDKIQKVDFDLDKKQKFDVQVPFTMTCTDIEQRLIDPHGSIDVTNTLDWRTQMKVDDPAYGSTVAEISMNKPFNYRGYRFFQAQTIPVGNARTIKLELTPQAGGDPLIVDIPRMGSATLADGTRVEYEDFQPDFTFNSKGEPDTRSGEYNNPAAILGVTPPDGSRARVFAFGGKLADNIPVGGS